MSAIRFTVVVFVYAADVEATTRFYEALGLRRQLSSETGGYEVLTSRSGGLAVHAAGTADRPVSHLRRASLTLETADAEAAAAALTQAGLQAEWWDEAYGRQLSVVDPHGEAIWISEEMRDLYGYRRHKHEPPSPVTGLCAVSFTDDPEADTAFYAHLGFTPAPGGTPAFRELVGAPGEGSIGLHERGAQPVDGVEASLTTTEDLATVAERAGALLGADAALDDDGVLRLTDPDGRAVELRAA